MNERQNSVFPQSFCTYFCLRQCFSLLCRKQRGALFARPALCHADRRSESRRLVPAVSAFRAVRAFLRLFARLCGTGGIARNRVFVCRKLRKKPTVPSLGALALCLVLFAAFSPFTPYSIPLDLPFTLGAVSQKIILAGLIFLLSAIFSVALKALLYKLLKCRLKAEELVFSVLFFVLIGIGICRAINVVAYMGIAFLSFWFFPVQQRTPRRWYAPLRSACRPRLWAGFHPNDFSSTELPWYCL